MLQRFKFSVPEGAFVSYRHDCCSQDLQLAEGEAVDTSEYQIRTLQEVRAEAERKVITMAMLHYDNNISEVARRLEISRPTLYSLIKKYAIKVD